jgi:hypothetical protein
MIITHIVCLNKQNKQQKQKETTQTLTRNPKWKLHWGERLPGKKGWS